MKLFCCFWIKIGILLGVKEILVNCLVWILIGRVFRDLVRMVLYLVLVIYNLFFIEVWNL